jgi:DNA-binding beta-propeller fold protein YncE
LQAPLPAPACACGHRRVCDRRIDRDLSERAVGQQIHLAAHSRPRHSAPGATTRFDYQAVDASRRRLFIAHLGDSTLDVIDLSSFHVIATVPHLDQVHGVTVAPDLARVFATATGSTELVTIDETANREIARTPTGSFSDGVADDPEDRLVFVSNKDDGTLTVVGAAASAR